MAILRYLFDAGGINSIVNFNRMSSLYPNLKVIGHTDSVIYIYAENREEATNYAEEYIRSLQDNSKQNKSDIVRNLTEMAIGGVIVPSGGNRILPEILGESTHK